MSVAAFVDLGPLVSPADVDDAVLATVQLWMNTYLALYEDRYSKARGFYARPASYASVVDEDQFMDGKLPAVIVATARANGQPIRAQGNSYSVDWLVAVSCVVRGRNAYEARRLAQAYDLLVKKLLVDHSSLGGMANGTIWVGGAEARPLPRDLAKGRYLVEGASRYLVRMDEVVRATAGPVRFEPDPPPAPDPAAPSTPAPDAGTPPTTDYEPLPVPVEVVDTDTVEAVPHLGG